MLNTEFSSWPSFTNEEAEAVSRVLLSNRVNYWTGQECREFETEYAEWCKCKYAITLSNGTVALDVSLKAMNVGIGDEVIVTSRTFLASVSSIVNAGATPKFVDISRDSQNITAETILSAITPKTKAIICVHLAGWPCEMDEIMLLAEQHQLYVIEDCAQAHGATYKGRMVGSIGHIGAWSFCQDKIMSTGGEGGMVTTNDRLLWSKMWSYKDHGKSWQAVYESEPKPGFRWLHDSFGTNWRMMEMQATIGRIQLKQMSNWTLQRSKNANTIFQLANEFPALRVPTIPSYIGHAAYKCYVFVEPGMLNSGWTRDRIVAEINSYGVPCFTGSCSEVYLERAFRGTGWVPRERLSIAKELGETSIMFMVHPTLTEDNISKTCEVLQKVMLLASNY